ncbi:FAD/NAD(P)-binding domain-containing protein [Butyriboletus roseoflavus]|nr:FAD/NAD(P)-binding domain-containing protein [Butyriboletus roseoflavus]
MSLPTLQRLSSQVPADFTQEKASAIATRWIKSFQGLCQSNPCRVVDLFLPDHPDHPPFWRDILALTWNFRTFAGGETISEFLRDQASVLRQICDCKPLEHAQLQQPWPDVAWIQAVFTFSIDLAHCMAVVRLVPMPDNSWKAHTVFTNMQDLKQHPEMTGINRDPHPAHGYWARQRAKELSFDDTTPEVIVVGAGHSGLSAAARLKFLGINALVVETNERIGDNWRNRYDSLCLHDSVWMDHLPYLPFPPTWPVFTPASKLAAWLESYAQNLDLNVWTSSTIVSARLSSDENGWNVVIRCPGGTLREFNNVQYLVLATGLGGGKWNYPKIPGMDTFSGKIMHSMQYRNALEHKSKRVFIIGSGTSAHDIAVDHCAAGIDVTIFQRSPIYVMTSAAKHAMSAGVYCENGSPLEVADCLNASYPNLIMAGEFGQRLTATLAQMDQDTLDGLDGAGFQRSMGINDTGLILLAWQRAGGYYIDSGASKLIAEGRIKIKNGTGISRITETGISFEDGTETTADVIVFATGLGNARDTVREICGDTVASRCTSIWGLDEEGELNGCWKEFGVVWANVGFIPSTLHFVSPCPAIKRLDADLEIKKSKL